MGQSRVVKRKKFKLILEPNRWEPNSMYYIRPTINDDVKIYITDINGTPFEVEGESGGGIELIRNSDGYLTVSGQNIVTINISQNLLDLINTKLSQGDNISNLVNDEGYIKLIDIANKLDKVESITTNTQMYVKNPDGTQGMMDVSNLSGISGIKRNGITLPIVSGEVDVIVPETTSELTNDSGYITENEVPIETVTRNGQLLNITNKNVDIEVPTQTSQLTNNSGFITQADIPPFDDKIEVIKRNGVVLPITNKEVNISVPTNVSELNNDENFISEVPIETISVNSQNIPIVGKNVNIEVITKHSELDLDDGTNPHGTTKADVGLGNVNNTSDLNKPISTATQTALNNKVDKVTGITPGTEIYVKNPDGTQGTLTRKRTFTLNLNFIQYNISNQTSVFTRSLTQVYNFPNAGFDFDTHPVLGGTSEIITPYKCKIIHISGTSGGIPTTKLEGCVYKSTTTNVQTGTVTPIYKFSFLNASNGITDIIDYNTIIDSNCAVKLAFRAAENFTGYYGNLTIFFEEVL